jgi:hypothetical protein
MGIGAGIMSGLLGGMARQKLTEEERQQKGKLAQTQAMMTLVGKLVSDPDIDREVRKYGLEALTRAIGAEGKGPRNKKGQPDPMNILTQFMEKITEGPAETKERPPITMQGGQEIGLPPFLTTLPAGETTRGLWQDPRVQARQKGEAVRAELGGTLGYEPSPAQLERKFIGPVPTSETAGQTQTVQIGDRIKQFNVKTGRYDIDVGSAKLPGRPLLSDFEQRVQDRIERRKLSNNALNRDIIGQQLIKEDAAARREPKEPEPDIESAAAKYLAAAGGDASKAIALLNKEASDAQASPELKRYAAQIRARIRERIRPGKAKTAIDRLEEILSAEEGD